MTQQEAYDWLLSERIREPAALILGTRHIVGRWEDVSNEINGYICRAGRVGIVVLGEGDDWTSAHAMAKARLSPP